MPAAHALLVAAPAAAVDLESRVARCLDERDQVVEGARPIGMAQLEALPHPQPRLGLEDPDAVPILLHRSSCVAK